MEITMTQSDLSEAYEVLNDALMTALSDLETYQSARDSLDATINEAILSGAITGKNETERKAQIAQIFGGQQDTVRVLQNNYERSRVRVQVSENNVACLRAILRLYEVARDTEK